MKVAIAILIALAAAVVLACVLGTVLIARTIKELEDNY